MTAETIALCSLITSIFSLSVAVTSAVVAFRLGSRFTALAKWARGLVTTKTSDAALAQINADLAESFSTLEKLTTTVKRLSSRHGMQDMRERRSTQGPPPPGASKAEVRKYYLVGKTPSEIAAMHKPDTQHEESN
jgi:hypothetical protein